MKILLVVICKRLKNNFKILKFMMKKCKIKYKFDNNNTMVFNIMVSVAKWNIIWKWNTIDYENKNVWKISIIYEKLNGIFLLLN